MRVVLERLTERRLNPEKIKAQINRIAGVATKGSRGRGWNFSLDEVSGPVEDGDKWSHKVEVNFDHTIDRDSVKAKLPNILRKIAEIGGSKAMQGRPWRVVEPIGYYDVVKADSESNRADEPKELGTISLVNNNEFDHIYDRKSQINRIFNSLELAVMTDFTKRSHCLLYGPPGCGKTEILEAFKKMLGEKDEAYLSFDGSNMTKAGVVEQLIDCEFVPPVLIIEEIEKCEEQHLRWLMSLMDKRGEIRRTNYRVGTQAKDVRMVVLATANNLDLLNKYLAGAISSRFDQKIYCPRPSDEIMRQILIREIKGIERANPEGNIEWVNKTIEFCYDKWGITDPRSLIAFCTSGRDKLLDGTAQREWEDTLDPMEKRKMLEEKKRRLQEQADLLVLQREAGALQ